MKRIFFIAIFVFGLALANRVNAEGQIIPFFIEPKSDISGRSDLQARLVKTTPKLYFFADTVWWDSQNELREAEVLNSLQVLSEEFEKHIYPNLTSAFGSEWKPGVDGDERITILIHQMQNELTGYFRDGDEYLKVQFPESNEREMIYLSADYLETPIMKSFLAHEFIHLVTFNQKEREQNVSEEIWLNEARAEYASTFLGYNNPLKGSNLELRVEDFLRNAADSLGEWQNKGEDYGIASLFIHYLVDHYGVGVLIDSLQSESIGIPSINEALKKNGFQEDFSQIFTDWTVAVLLNDCVYGKRYCYLNQNLRDLKVTPGLNLLPLSAKSTLSLVHIAKNWSAHWEKFVGGQGVLQFTFEGLKGLQFKLPYIVQDKDGVYRIDFVILTNEQKGEVLISDFGTQYKAFFVIPSLQTKLSGFSEGEPEATYPFSLKVSILERTPAEEQQLIRQLLLQIESLQIEIAKAKAQLDALLFGKTTSCVLFERDIFFGMQNNKEVRCLQEILKRRGPDVYPEGLVTGNFFSLTQKAVARFQEKYASEVLSPLGLTKGTGYVGVYTRKKLNAFLQGIDLDRNL